MTSDNQYITSLKEIKQHIVRAQQLAGLSVNAHMLYLYWEIGMYIKQQKEKLEWGSKIVTQFSRDIQAEFPNMKGFSCRNLRYMIRFAETYPLEILQLPIWQPAAAKLDKTHKTDSLEFVQPLAAQIDFYTFISTTIAKITWSHHLVLLDKTNSLDERMYYMNRTISEGWSKRVLIHKIEQKLFESQGSLSNNFDNTLPPLQSELAKASLKDPYIFDFLTIGDKVKERELEDAPLKEITKFLLELGSGFAFLGQQYAIQIGGNNYFLDLLFYHLKLKAYFIIELKIDEFKPEYAGNVNFYINATDDILKSKDDKPTIGLLLCKSTNKIVAEYSLQSINKPIGVATYKLLPKEKDFISILKNTTIPILK